MVLALALLPAGGAWAAAGDPIHGVDVKLGIVGGAFIESTSVSAVRGGAMSIAGPRDVATGQPTGRRLHRPGRPVFGNITFERPVGKSQAWREHGSGLATGKRQHGKMVAYEITVTQSDDKGGQQRSVTWNDCFPTQYAVVEVTLPGGRRIAVEQISFEPGSAQFQTRARGGVPAGTLGVDVDGDGSPDFAATRQVLSSDPGLGFAPGSSEDPSLALEWTIDTAGPTTSFFAVLNGIIGPEKPAGGKAGIIGPEINAAVTDGGKLVDEFHGLRLCGFVPAQLGDEAAGVSAASSDRTMLCGKTNHL